MQYVFEPSLTRATIRDYTALFRLSFAGDYKLGEDYLTWLYQMNPHGKVIGTDAFTAAGELAAHYAIIPRRYRMIESFAAALSVNTATHPTHQGQGLFVRLAEATYEKARDLGIRFVVGVANANSIGGFSRRLSFRTLGNVGLYVGRGLPANPEQHSLDIDVDRQWLAWRLGNPARVYTKRDLGGGCISIRTVVKGVPFDLLCVCNPQLDVHALVNTRNPFALIPHFGANSPSLIRLPLRVQPSPWHMIWRALDQSLPPNLSDHLVMQGIGMDTF